VNLVLLEPAEISATLPRTDRRAQHVLEVLRRNVGETFDAGIVNGALGKAKVTSISADGLTFSFTSTGEAVPPSPITLLVGLPRPQTARDVLRDATTLGVAAIHFVRTDKTEPSYAQSSLWTSGEWRRHALAGAEQAFATHLPEISYDRPFTAVVASPRSSLRVALDNYESPHPLSAMAIPPSASVVIAIGAERGWSISERDALRSHGFQLAHLGSRVLRTETAVIAAVSIIRAKLGLM
jgi:16S rRNA (uracil1498-N3)-methyltransferase